MGVRCCSCRVLYRNCYGKLAPFIFLMLCRRSLDTYSFMQNIIAQIAQEIRVQEKQVKAAVELLDGGATVPFIARYRKEATGGLDDIQLRELEYRLGYLRELEDRRAAIAASIAEQGKMTPVLLDAI